MSHLQSSHPMQGIPRNQAPQVQRVGIRETLNAPGLVVPKPFSKSAQVADQMMQAMGMVGQVVGQAGAMIKQDRIETENEQRGLATEHGNTFITQFDASVQNGEVELPRPDDIESFADGIISQETEGFSDAYQSRYRAAFKPRIIKSLVNKSQAIRKQEARENIHLLASSVITATSVAGIKSALQSGRDNYGLTRLQALEFIALPAMNNASKIQDIDKFNQAASVLAKDFPDIVEQARFELDHKLLEKQQATHYNDLQVRTLDKDWIKNADGQPSSVATIEEIERRSHLATDDEMYLSPGQRMHLTNLVKTDVAQGNVSNAIEAVWNGSGGSLTSEHDTGLMSFFRSQKLLDDSGAPTNNIALAAAVKRMGRLPSNLKKWVDANAASDNPENVKAAAMLYYNLKRTAPDVLAKSGDLSELSKMRMTAVFAAVEGSSETVLSEKFDEVMTEAVNNALVLKEDVLKGIDKGSLLSEMTGQQYAEGQVQAVQKMIREQLPEFLKTQSWFWWFDKDIEMPSNHPQFNRDMMNTVMKYYAAFKQQNGGQGKPLNQAMQAAFTELKAKYVFATMNDKLYILDATNIHDEMRWGETTAQQFKHEFDTVINVGTKTKLTPFVTPEGLAIGGDALKVKYKSSIEKSDRGLKSEEWQPTTQPDKPGYLFTHIDTGELLRMPNGDLVVWRPMTKDEELQSQFHENKMREDAAEKEAEKIAEQKEIKTFNTKFDTIDLVVKNRYLKLHGMRYDPRLDKANDQVKPEHIRWYQANTHRRYPKASPNFLHWQTRRLIEMPVPAGIVAEEPSLFDFDINDINKMYYKQAQGLMGF